MDLISASSLKATEELDDVKLCQVAYKNSAIECKIIFKLPVYNVYSDGSIIGEVIIDEAKRRNEYGSYISK